VTLVGVTASTLRLRNQRPTSLHLLAAAAVRAADAPQQWRLATSLRAGTIAAIFLGQRSSTNESGSKKVGGVGGIHGVGPIRHIDVGHTFEPFHAWRSQPPISFSASNRCTELDLCGSSRQRSLGPGGSLPVGRACTVHC
jgi:hypothetical protein